MTTKETRVGVVGLGAMGLGMATTLASNGFAVKGFDLSDDRRKLAAEGGVSPCETLADVFARIDFIVFSLPTAKDVAAVVEANLDALKAAGDRVVIIDTSTSEPDVSRDLAAGLNALGHGFLDAPVSGGPAGAASGSLTMMIGGSDADVTRAKMVIDAMAAKALHVGPSGAGNVAKLVNNLLAAAHMVTTGEGLKLALSAGLEPEQALKVLNAASGKSMISDVHFPTWVMNDRFDSGFTMGLMRKDVRLASELAARTGAALPLSATVARLWAESPLDNADDFTRMGAFRAAANDNR
ncbi:3-hydroxyisobutyrate dehydrogenase [Sinorhizobium sp. A49]|uniref:NAD(P)-dependent oxidoreductase n=1 Tax=Sinorhizobium sp. A49 TaxID=1945861 RepID=UPI000985BC11|nr:NAD(P)-dependent oxidoreductase [Sinorhizobium sp. A49]OOG71391.1 3-hydroxyisobutyrate dehydrogenase [Sinorhizobium sp. A49]